MKKFKSIKNKKNKIVLIIIFVVLISFCILKLFHNRFNDNIMYLSRIKIEELTNNYLNNTIKKYLNLDTNDYIKLNLVNNNIVSVDIDNNNTNKLLEKIINDLENNVVKIDRKYYNLELIDDSDSIVLYIPFGVIFNNVLLSNFGPLIPIKISFLENIDSYVDVEVQNYGINNSLVKLYININLKIIIEMPIDKNVSSINYRFLLASKLINGKVPNIYGGNLGVNSSIVN